MKNRHINNCFVCGQGNPQGLQVNFEHKNGMVVGEFTPSDKHQGPQGILHGGLICALMDEAMATLITSILGKPAATASLEVRFKNSARINKRLNIQAKLISQDRRIRSVQASVQRQDGAVIATGIGKFLGDFK